MVNKLFLDKIIERFVVVPADLLHLLILLITYSLKSSLESKTNPECFWLFSDWTFGWLDIVIKF